MIAMKSFPTSIVITERSHTLSGYVEALPLSANLPDPDVIATEIAEDLQAALDQFSQIATDLKT